MAGTDSQSTKVAKGTPRKDVKSTPQLGPLPTEETPFKTPVLVRANFYRDTYRRLMIMCLGLVLIIVGLMGWILWERTHKPAQHFYATSSDGRLIQLRPLSQPNLTTAALLEWVVEAATTSYNFNFGNYKTALQNIRTYFTPEGYDKYIAALKAAKTIDTVVSKQLVVFAVPTDTPVILQEGPREDSAIPGGSSYAWEVQLPMLVTYQSASEQIKQNIVITMLIIRMPTLESPKGIGIASITVKEK